MSINASTNYMSSSSIEAWMETKTEDLYGSMRGAMDVSNTRAKAEEALNDIKAKIADAQQHGTDTADLRQEIKATLSEFKDVPEVATALGPIDTELTKRADAAQLAANTPIQMLGVVIPAAGVPKPVTLEKSDADNWTKQIGDTVDALGKQDQLGLINIQEFNSQINQTKQIASALMDAADKAANSIINHIS